MKFLCRSEVAEFINREVVSHIDTTHMNLITYDVPKEFGRLLTSMKFIFETMFSGEWSLAIIESAGIWPTWEDRNLYSMIRKLKGASLEWEYGEGHLFAYNEISDLISLVTIFTNFRWDFKVINQSNSLKLNVSHDDIVSLHLKNPNEVFIQKLTTIIDKKIKF
jgi:hypothetical protein